MKLASSCKFLKNAHNNNDMAVTKIMLYFESHALVILQRNSVEKNKGIKERPSTGSAKLWLNHMTGVSNNTWLTPLLHIMLQNNFSYNFRIVVHASPLCQKSPPNLYFRVAFLNSSINWQLPFQREAFSQVSSLHSCRILFVENIKPLLWSTRTLWPLLCRTL